MGVERASRHHDLARRTRLTSCVALFLLASPVLLASPAAADVTHVVQRGHTIQAIARRYHVTEKAILDANHLTDATHLKPGQSLIIPGVDGPKKKHGAAPESPEKHDGVAPHAGVAHPARAGHSTTAEIASPVEPRGHPGDRDTIHAVRLGEDFHVRVRDAHGHVPPSALKAFERLMRQGNATHSVDPRLVTLVGIVSNHFGGATIDVVSGYRAYKTTQYTAHSNHNLGKALDFRMAGVSDEALRDFCRTLRSAGCGYYPNDTFVHLDVRDTKAYWVDLSHKGEAPKYEKPGVLADEATSDVADDRGESATVPPAHESIETQGAAVAPDASK